MGFLRNLKDAAARTKRGMVNGTPGSFYGVDPAGTGNSGTGYGGSGTGDGNVRTGTGHGLTPQQVALFRKRFYGQHGRYPSSEGEFERWLKNSG
jgi:hypothetical protein